MRYVVLGLLAIAVLGCQKHDPTGPTNNIITGKFTLKLPPGCDPAPDAPRCK